MKANKYAKCCLEKTKRMFVIHKSSLRHYNTRKVREESRKVRESHLNHWLFSKNLINEHLNVFFVPMQKKMLRQYVEIPKGNKIKKKYPMFF